MPEGSADPVTFVKLAVILAASGNEPSAENSGETTAAKTNPIIKAHIAPIAASISANETTGILSTSLPSSANLIPPNLGTNALYSNTEKKLTAIVLKNAAIGSSIIKGIPTPVIRLNWPSWDITPVA